MELSNLIEDLKSNTLCWYPSSGLDLKPLYYFGSKDFILNNPDSFANEQVYFDNIPKLFVYSDKAYDNNNWPLNEKGLLSELDGVKYTLEVIEDIFYDFEIVGKYLEIRVHSEGVKKLQKILFLFKDNSELLSDFFLENRISIEFVLNIRDGFSENGGSDYSMKFIEYLLGFLNSQYLVSDNFGREPMISQQIRDNRKIMQAISSRENKTVSLQGLKEFTWSEYGVFLGDAILMRVHKLL